MARTKKKYDFAVKSYVVGTIVHFPKNYSLVSFKGCNDCEDYWDWDCCCWELVPAAAVDDDELLVAWVVWVVWVVIGVFVVVPESVAVDAVVSLIELLLFVVVGVFVDCFYGAGFVSFLLGVLFVCVCVWLWFLLFTLLVVVVLLDYELVLILVLVVCCWFPVFDVEDWPEITVWEGE